jgi:hypothetical protein
MKYRKLRIVWSVGCGVLCLLLIALWVRSYRGVDANQSLSIASSQGRLYLNQSLTISPLYNGPVLSTPHFGGIYTFTPSSARIQFIHPGFGVPYWSLVLAVVAAGITPWLRWRFSLRTLLIGLTVISVAAGMISWTTR